MSAYLITPEGFAVTEILTEACYFADVTEVKASGEVEDYQCNDFPDMEEFGPYQHVRAPDLNDYLGAHCRYFEEGEESIDPWASEPILPPWPDEIVKACQRAERLATALKRLRDLEWAMPKHITDDPFTKAAIENVLEARLQGEFDELCAQIDNYRKETGQ